ncbi:putative mitochondrial protein [Tanacetum coccineum]
MPKSDVSLEVVVDNDEEDIVWEPTNEDVDYDLSDVINVVQVENSVPHISINALTSRNTFQTMRVSGYVGKHEIHILIDSGSTHKFLDSNTAKRIGCQLKSTYPLQVTVANGNNMMSNKISRIKWSLQGEEFVADMMRLPLGGCEMVLGIQWLFTLGNIICNFRDLNMSFQYNGRRINLRGSQKGVVQWLQVLNMVTAKPKTIDVPKGLQNLLEDYNDVFAIPKALPPIRSHDHRIPLKEGTPTINIRPYRHPATQKDAIERVATDPTKIQAMKEWHAPKNLKQLRGFLDLTRYYRRFIKNYAMISYPLTKLLRKNAFVWNKEAEQVFVQLKEAMMAAPILKLPNFEEDFVVETDASREGIGAVLKQQGHPVAYLSKALSPKHQLLSTYEKEFLTRISTPTLIKWLPKLMGFYYEIEYKRGKDNVVADALSRIQGNAQLLNMMVSTVSSDVQQRIMESWTQDGEIQALIAKLKGGKACPKHYSWFNNLLTRKGKLVIGNDISLQHDLVEYFHAGTTGRHLGVKLTTHSMCALLYWKKMRKHIKQLVNECSVCQLNKVDLGAYLGLLKPLPIPQSVWSEVSMDFINGLPASKGKTMILVVVDKYSKYSHFVPLSHPYSAIQVAQAFLDNIYKLHGLPKAIVSDRDKVFLSMFWQELFKLLDVSLHISTAYHPQSYGHTEVVNRCLEGYLRCMTGERPKEWGDINVDVVDRSMTAREEAIALLKHHKLSPKFYGPYQVTAKVGKVAYRLSLPASSQIHLVFHESQLKAHKGDCPNSQQALLEVNKDALISDKPQAVLERKTIKKGPEETGYVLVQWVNVFREDATWELLTDMISSYPQFSWDS